MGTHYRGSKKVMRALDTYTKLIRSAESINSRINLLLSKTGLTESQFNVLDALFHLGPLSQKELGKKLLRSGGNITMVIDNLEKRGFVERKRGKADRRLFFVHLKTKGKHQIGKVLPEQVLAIVNEMNVLNKYEQTELQKLCKKVGLIKK
jgi:MarR family 2-MHQ and catechol resistance regulon transcriptional repressor